MIFAWLALSVAAGPAPPWLTAANPNELLRWHAVALTSADATTDTSVTAVRDDAPVQIVLAGAGLVRLRGRFVSDCELAATRRFNDEGGALDIPLELTTDGVDRLLSVSPAVAAPDAQDEELPSTSVILALPKGCAPLPLEAFVAARELDAYGWLRIAAELRQLAGEGGLPLMGDSTNPPAHAWQADAALALALPSLLARLPGSDGGVRHLSRAWAEMALDDGRVDDVDFAFVRPLVLPLTERELPGPAPLGYLVQRARTIEIGVEGVHAVRLFSRATLTPTDGRVAYSLSARFDDRRPTMSPAASPVDPAAPGLAREREFALAVPPGAKRLYVQVDHEIVLRGILVNHKSHVEDALTSHTVTELLAAATREASQDARGGVVAALAAATLGTPKAWQERTLRTTDDAAIGALLAVLRVEHAPGHDPTAEDEARDALAALARESTLAGLHAVLTSRFDRAEVHALLAGGRAREAVDRLLGLAARQPLASEDAALLAQADALVADGLDSGSRVLAVLDRLLAQRPLDHTLAIARARSWATTSAWRALPVAIETRHAWFLEPARPLSAPDTPLPSAGAPERFTYTALRHEAPLLLALPYSGLAARTPVLTLVAVRGQTLGRAAKIRIDEREYLLPAISALERNEIPVPAGEHTLSLATSDFAGEIFANFAPAAEPLRLRRYSLLPASGLEAAYRDVGQPAIAELSLRVAVPLGTSMPSEILLEIDGAGAHPLTLHVHPALPHRETRTDLDPELLVTAPCRATFPIDGGGASLRIVATTPAQVQVYAQLAVRRHHAPDTPRAKPDAVDTEVRAGGANEALDTIARASAALSKPGAHGALRIERAAALMDLDEPALAREDLLVALEERPLGPHLRAAAANLWRDLEEADSDGSASVPSGITTLSPLLHLSATHPGLMSVGLLGLLDEPGALQTSPAAELRQRAGEGAPLALLAAARLAEQRGDADRAAVLWLALAADEPDSALIRREAGEALLATGDVGDAARAYLELFAATRLEPRDARAHRFLRKAAARTRLRPLRFANESAGSVMVTVVGGEPLDPSVEDVLLPVPSTAERATLLTRGRQTHLSLSLGSPLQVRLRADWRELRPREINAQASAPVTLNWQRDGETPVSVVCVPAQICSSPSIALAEGEHALDIHLDGGLRPAARLYVDAQHESRATGSTPAGVPDATLAAAHVLEHLVARPVQPIRLTVQGPALLRVECRSQLGPRGARSLSVLAQPPSGDGPRRQIELVPRPDERTSSGGVPLSIAAIEFIDLPAAAPYALELRPVQGEALVRLLVREPLEGAPTPEIPVAVDDATSAVRVAAQRSPAAPLSPAAPPSPASTTALAAPERIHVLEAEVRPGLDDLGSLTATMGAMQRSENSAGAPVQTTRGVTTGLAYRRALELTHTTVEVASELRLLARAAASEWLGAEVFFLHPGLRNLRAQLTLDAYHQSFGAKQAYRGKARVMLEPVYTLRSGLHFVGRLGASDSTRSLTNVSDAALPALDPDVYSRFDAAHGRALFLNAGLEAEPFANVVLFGDARWTSNRSLSPLDQDHASSSVLCRVLIGRTYLEAKARGVWFFVDGDRPDPAFHKTLFASIGQTLWPDALQHVNGLLSAAYHLDRVRRFEITVALAWEASNGRRFLDHSPIAEENYFFPQLGPGFEDGGLIARAPTTVNR